jgi:predicted DNA-binding transcriptional regulator AlpA
VELPAAAQAALDRDPVLTRPQAAHFLGVAASTLADWVKGGKGPPFYDYGREAGYPLSALLAWRQSQLKQHSEPETEPEPVPVKRKRGRPRLVTSRTGTAKRAGLKKRTITKRPPLKKTITKRPSAAKTRRARGR